MPDTLTSKTVLLAAIAVTAAAGCDGAPLSFLSEANAAPAGKSRPRSGVITLNQGNNLRHNSEGVVQIDLATGEKRHFLDGTNPRRYANGVTLFLQGCPDGSRLALADTRGLIRVISPCSSQLESPGPSKFDFAHLSPDSRRVAVETVYYKRTVSAYSVVVFEVSSKRQIAFLDGYNSPVWTPSGRLVVVGNNEGLYIADASLSNLDRVDREQLNGPVGNPAMHPSGKRVAFEYNKQIWEMNLDGSGLRERAHGSLQLRFPEYSPDGKFVVYLGTPQADDYEKTLFFTNLETDENSHMNLRREDWNGGWQVPRGPLSWTATSGR